MKSKTPLSLLIVFFVISIMNLSCSKDDANNETTNTQDVTNKATLFHANSSKLWKLTNEKINSIDVTDGLKDCVLDDLHKFDNIDNYIHDEGTIKCDDDNPNENRYKYVQREDYKYLDISNNDTSYTAELIQLDTKVMIWKINADSDVIEKTFEAL